MRFSCFVSMRCGDKRKTKIPRIRHDSGDCDYIGCVLKLYGRIMQDVFEDDGSCSASRPNHVMDHIIDLWFSQVKGKLDILDRQAEQCEQEDYGYDCLIVLPSFDE